MSELGVPSNSEFWFGEPSGYPRVLTISSDMVVRAGKELVIPGLVDELKSAQEALFLKETAQGLLGLDGFALRSLSFCLHPEWAEGRTDSTHQVFFGELALVSDQGVIGDDERVTVLPVAVKPFHIDRRRGVHEFAAYDYIGANTKIPTLNPLGFWVDDESKTYMLTHFQHEVETLDNVDWHKTGDDKLKEHFSLFEALQRSAMILGWLHGNGNAHYDAQIKNMALKDGGVCLIDLESFRRVTEPEQDDPEALGQAILADLKKLLESVLKRQYLWSDIRRDRVNMVKMALLEAHGSLMRHPSTPMNSTDMTQIISDIHSDLLDSI